MQLKDMQSEDFLKALEAGHLRAAEKKDGSWVVDLAIKARILDLFKQTQVKDMPGGFRDKFFTRSFHVEDHVRMVPGGSSVRAGTYIGKNVVIMPPSYINIGAYVDEGTMVDSHVLVGSCAQIGKRVHLSAAVQIGGVLEPIGQRPTIVEDDCFLSAGVILVEGILVRARAVLATGVQLSASIPIYDIVCNKIYRGEIPEDAVVVPGSRSFKDLWAQQEGLSLSCAVIVKYRDAHTATSIVLEDALRSTQGLC